MKGLLEMGPSKSGVLLRSMILFPILAFQGFSQSYVDDDFPLRRHALGFKARFPVAGLNYIGWLHEQVGVEAIGTFISIGISGNTTSLKMFGMALRARTKYDSNIFPYGGIGFTRWYEEYNFNFGGVNDHRSYTNNGVNIYIGIEYFRPEFPSIGFDAEVGYSTAALLSVKIGAVSYGAGIHFYF